MFAKLDIDEPLHNLMGIPESQLGVKATTGLVGLELEMEFQKSKMPEISSKSPWMVTKDDSLRNGVEFVSHPMEPKVVYDHLGALFERIRGGLKGKKITECLRPSWRCSIHVHVNALPMPLKSILAAGVTWWLLEERVFEGLSNVHPHGRFRKGNPYCLRLFDTPTLARMWGNSFEWGDAGVKYAAMNVLPLMNWGTLEFRALPLSLNRNLISEWATDLSSMLRFCEGQTARSILDYYEDMETYEFMHMVGLKKVAGWADFNHDYVEEGRDNFLTLEKLVDRIEESST